MPGDQELVRSAVVDKAMLLRSVAPEQWEAFVRTMALYAAAMAKDMVKAEPDRLHWAQGRAQAVEQVADLLFNAPKLYERQQQAADEKRRMNDGRKPHPANWTA